MPLRTQMFFAIKICQWYFNCSLGDEKRLKDRNGIEENEKTMFANAAYYQSRRQRTSSVMENDS